MKVLLVDDEKHVRHTIRLLVDWNRFGVTAVLEAQNGNEAREIIEKERPQIIIMDVMMPESDGMELLTWVDTHYKESKKIMLSAYNDFEFVRNTVKHGGSDYLLKPIVPQQLQESLQNAIHCWNKEEQERSQSASNHEEVNKLRSIYIDKALSSMISSVNEVPRKEMELLVRQFSELEHVYACRYVFIDLHPVSLLVRDQFQSDMETFINFVLNICNELLHGDNLGHAFQNLNHGNELGILLWGSLEAAASVFDKVNEHVALILNAKLHFGISSELPFPDNLSEAYWQAREEDSRRNLLDYRLYIHVFSPEPSGYVQSLRFFEFGEVIGTALFSGNPERIRRSVQGWFDIIGNMSHLSRKQLDLWLKEYKVWQTRWIETSLLRLGREEERTAEAADFTIPLDNKGQFCLTLFEERFFEHLLGNMQRVSGPKAKGAHSMNEIAEYIQLNYKQNITLQDISDKFYLNREYVSRKFKQEMNGNVIDYLNRVRIDKSKSLLMNPILRIHEVALLVGYKDEKYFSRVFKKVEGISPKQYRSTMGCSEMC